MSKPNTESYKKLEKLIAESGNTYAFSADASLECFKALFEIVKEMGFDPMKTDELRQGIMLLFNIEIINGPDFENNRFILTPNHVSDWDAIIFGLLYPKIRIVAKTDWTSNEKLKPFLDLHYNLYGLERTSLHSLRGLLADSIRYFNESDDNRHFLVFSQGTISDFNNNSPERISTIAQKISVKTNVPIVNVYSEQVSLYHPTRIVFDKPIILSSKDDFRNIWLEREKSMQSSLVPPARYPNLLHKHANNNKPGDPFF